jgi:hypothetical protein
VARMINVEVQIGKRFDEKTDEFVNLANTVDLDRLERIRFLASQLNLLSSKIQKLEKMVQSGDFEFSNEELTKKLDDIDKRLGKMDSKSEFFSIFFATVKETTLNTHEAANNSAELEELKKINDRMNTIEKKYSVLSTPKMKGVFFNLIETVEILSNRTKNLEIMIANLRDIKWGKTVRSFKEELKSDTVNKDSNWMSIHSSLQKLKITDKKEKKDEKK